MFLRNAMVAAGLLATVINGVPTNQPRKASDGKRLTIYWGAEDDNVSLQTVCADSSYDIVNLAFLAYFHGPGGYPTMEIQGLYDTTAAQQKAGATGLKDGSSLVSSIKACQAAGKLVLLSMGGAVDYSNATLSSDADGQKIADQMWNLFLGGTATNSLRPFGSVKLDGVDLDNESGDPTGYLAMTKRLRSNYELDTSKKYYISAAPQCPFPDASEPLDVCKLLDFVWVQFYNNGDCNIGQPNFISAVKKWSAGIGSATLFIGAVASSSDGDQGYVSSSSMVSSLNKVKALNLPNYGGAMLWEAELAVNNGNYQKAIAAGL